MNTELIMYECVICHTLNSATRLHCQNCGTVPAMYSVTGKPAKNEFSLTEDVIANGAMRAEQWHSRRCALRTVEPTYYAEI